MKRVLLFALTIFCMLNGLGVSAQDKEEKKKDITSYKQAHDLYEQAQKLWKNEQLAESDKLYAKAILAYPIYAYVYAYANKKMEIGDIKGGNAIWETMIARLREEKDLLFELSSSWPVVYDYEPAEKTIAKIYTARAYSNATSGSILQSLQDYKSLSKIKKMDANEWSMIGTYAIQTRDFETAQRAIDTLNVIYANGRKKLMDAQLQPVFLSASLNLAQGKFKESLVFSERLENEDKGLNTTWKGFARMMKAEAYIGLGDVQKAKEYLDMAVKHVAFSKNNPDVAYTAGLIALYNKDYKQALNSFNANLNYKSGFFAQAVVWLKHRTYTKRAEAYAGLKDMVNARQDYESALVYYPNYEPAIAGLAKLEGRIQTELVTDKNPPVITVTEPANTRGIKVVAKGHEVMIKGLAVDPSGLKSVSLNDQVVFSQENGNFWGNVVLAEGLNKVLIKATDLAGNTGELSIEVERPKAIVAVADNIVEVKSEGKNYALLIASQNYDDTAIPSLENPIPDAVKLKIVLKNSYNFPDANIVTLYNPGVNDFKKKFIELGEMLQPEDNLVIFYAGHGIWVSKEKKGYWLLTDAKRNDANSWLPNRDVLDMISKLPSRHTLLITDACFSGSVFKTRGIGENAPAALKEMDQKISRVAITSGNDTEVPDESVFMKYLVKALNENKDKYLTAQKMFVNQIIEAVMTETKTEPRYGTLELAGHVGGDFIFNKK